jgi:hypothetical protein
VLSEVSANWRGAWKRLERNPLLLLTLIVGIGAVAEGIARLMDLLQEGLLYARLDYFLTTLTLQFVSLGGTLTVFLLSTAAALFVVLHEGSFFRSSSALAPRRFWWRATLAWHIIYIVRQAKGRLRRQPAYSLSNPSVS